MGTISSDVHSKKGKKNLDITLILKILQVHITVYCHKDMTITVDMMGFNLNNLVSVTSGGELVT